jgi:hypothetical protein
MVNQTSGASLKPGVYRQRTEHGVDLVLAYPSRDRLHLVVLATPITCRLAAFGEARHLRRVPYKDSDYPLSRALQQFHRMARKRGITKAAKAELKRLADF